jgi:hypothetical protein
MQYTVDSEQFDNSWHLLMRLFVETVVSTLNQKVIDSDRRLGFAPSLRWAMSYLAHYSKLNQMAGLYMNLFLLAIRILSLRRKDPGIKILIAASCIMAVLGTLQMAVTIAMTTLDIRFIRQVVHSQVMKQFRPDAVEKLLTVQNGIFTINKWVNPIPEVQS